MRTKRWIPVTLALAICIGSALPVAGQRPDPHSRDNGTPASTAEATAVVSGCELIEPYVEALYSTIDESGAFADFFYDPDVSFGDITERQANRIIADGDAMMDDLEVLDVPPPYAEAHRNIQGFLGVQIDMARFYGIDTSVVPDITAYEAALATISEGETALIDACPDEMQAVGGYILIDPADVDVPVDPESMPD